MKHLRKSCEIIQQGRLVFAKFLTKCRSQNIVETIDEKLEMEIVGAKFVLQNHMKSQ